MFNVSTITSTSANFSWMPPPIEQQNGIIIGYTIIYTVTDTNEAFFELTNDTFLFIDTLKPFQNYSFKIAANTSEGVGPFSPPINIKTNEDGKNNYCILNHHVIIIIM